MRALSLLALMTLAVACQGATHDPNETGLRIGPPPGTLDAPVTLYVANRTGLDLRCEVAQGDRCPPLPDVEALEVLPVGSLQAWVDITCADLDVSCFPTDAPPTERPVRSWVWVVEELDEI
jgi:hypothetical protein